MTAFGDKLFGVKGGVQVNVAGYMETGFMFTPAIGVAINLEEADRTSLFGDLEVGYTFARGSRWAPASRYGTSPTAISSLWMAWHGRVPGMEKRDEEAQARREPRVAPVLRSHERPGCELSVLGWAPTCSSRDFAE